VIAYVREKYGERSVAQIGTFGTLAARAAVKDVGRAMDIPYGDVDRIAKMVPTTLNIKLDDASGQPVDNVRYADEGDWAIRQRGPLDSGHRGWEWFAEHDGLAKSLELINPKLPSAYGQNWTASRVVNGTPGTINSVSSNNIAPLILDVIHFPIVPRSTNSISIGARFIDVVRKTQIVVEALVPSAYLFVRRLTQTPLQRF